SEELARCSRKAPVIVERARKSIRFAVGLAPVAMPKAHESNASFQLSASARAFEVLTRRAYSLAPSVVRPVKSSAYRSNSDWRALGSGCVVSPPGTTAVTTCPGKLAVCRATWQPFIARTHNSHSLIALRGFLQNGLARWLSAAFTVSLLFSCWSRVLLISTQCLDSICRRKGFFAQNSSIARRTFKPVGRD